MISRTSQSRTVANDGATDDDAIPLFRETLNGPVDAMRQPRSDLPVGRDREGTALPPRVSSVPIRKGVMPVHRSRDSSICCWSADPVDKDTLQ